MNNDLISREALKRTACVKFYTTPYYKHILDLIDNAPTVKPYCYFCGQTEHGKIEEKSYFQRQKGKWKLHGMIYYCSECGHDCGESGDNFCGNCGADMRGKEE